MTLFPQIPAFLSRHKSAALCIVTGTDGSTPRKMGSKMLVAPDGTIEGTVGGGAIEKQVIDDALEAMRTQKPMKKFYRLEEDLRMECGGNVEVYIEPIGRRPALYIFGAGHVGKALAAFAHQLDFEVTLLDFRDISFTEEEKARYRFIHGDYLETMDLLEFDDNTYIAVMSPTHEHDFELTARMGKKSFAYLGMIGSMRKVAKTRERLQNEKNYSEEEINAIDMPMGLKMAAETPEEIAISIVAKMTDVRNRKLKT